MPNENRTEVLRRLREEYPEYWTLTNEGDDLCISVESETAVRIQIRGITFTLTGQNVFNFSQQLFNMYNGFLRLPPTIRTPRTTTTRTTGSGSTRLERRNLSTFDMPIWDTLTQPVIEMPNWEQIPVEEQAPRAGRFEVPGPSRPTEASLSSPVETVCGDGSCSVCYPEAHGYSMDHDPMDIDGNSL